MIPDKTFTLSMGVIMKTDRPGKSGILLEAL
jgi:hypothetical protein